MTWKEFLEKIPPGASEVIESVLSPIEPNKLRVGQDLDVPDISRYCENEKCQGERIFTRIRSLGNVWLSNDRYIIQYICRNCNSQVISIGIRLDGPLLGPTTAMKFGEFPPFGLPVPARVMKLIGPDRDLFLKGRRSESQGLGVGAYAYYRQVVERQWRRLIDQMAKAARRTGADDDTMAVFERASRERQFAKAVDDLKDAIPKGLLLNGHNPLKLLHGTLSEQIHNGSDEECLKLATSIRVVLTQLADMINVLMQNQTEVETALSNLLNRNAPKPPSLEG